MKMIMVMVAAAMALGVSPANAENWVRVGSDEETEHYVDEASLARDGEIVRLTKRAVYRAPQPIGGTAGMPLIVESVGVVEDDCTRNQHRVISIRLIGEEQKVIWSSGEMKRVWETIEPGSPGQATLEFVCARTASR
jgi:hypothetical protein